MAEKPKIFRVGARSATESGNRSALSGNGITLYCHGDWAVHRGRTRSHRFFSALLYSDSFYSPSFCSFWSVTFCSPLFYLVTLRIHIPRHFSSPSSLHSSCHHCLSRLNDVFAPSRASLLPPSDRVAPPVHRPRPIRQFYP